MNRKEEKKILKQASELKDKLVDVLNEADVELGLVMTVLVALTVDTGLSMAQIPPHEFIRMLAQSVCRAQEVIEERNEEDEEEEDEQTISRTTH